MKYTRYTLKLLLCLIFVGLVGCEPEIEKETQTSNISTLSNKINTESILYTDFLKEVGKDNSHKNIIFSESDAITFYEQGTKITGENFTSYSFLVKN